MRIVCIAGLLILFAGFAPGVQGSSDSDEDRVRERYKESYRYERVRNYEDAIKVMLTIARNRPSDYTVNMRLGWLYYLDAKHANAKSRYQKAIRISPSSIEARLGYMLPLLAQGRYQETESVAKQITKFDPDNYYANLRLVFAMRMQRKYEQAERIASYMLLRYPSDVSFLLESGLSKTARGRSRDAMVMYKRVLQLDPENVTATYQMSRIYRRVAKRNGK